MDQGEDNQKHNGQPDAPTEITETPSNHTNPPENCDASHALKEFKVGSTVREGWARGHGYENVFNITLTIIQILKFCVSPEDESHFAAVGVTNKKVAAASRRCSYFGKTTAGRRCHYVTYLLD